DLFLSGVIGGNGERHQLLERHAVIGIDVEQLWGYRRKPKTLLHDANGYEEDGCDVLLGFPLLAQGLERTKLVEGMKRDAMHVLSQRILLRADLGAHVTDNAGHRSGLPEAL